MTRPYICSQLTRTSAMCPVDGDGTTVDTTDVIRLGDGCPSVFVMMPHWRLMTMTMFSLPQHWKLLLTKLHQKVPVFSLKVPVCRGNVSSDGTKVYSDINLNIKEQASTGSNITFILECSLLGTPALRH